MPGYDPSCGNCHRCLKCRGDGTVMNVTYEKNHKGDQVRVERRDTCPSCRGVGGQVGSGPHNHR